MNLHSFNSDSMDSAIDEVLDNMQEQESKYTKHESRMKDWVKQMLRNTDIEVAKADIVRAHRIVKASLASIDHGATITCDFSTTIGKSALRPMLDGLRASEEVLNLAIEELDIPTYTSGLPPLTSCDL